MVKKILLIAGLLLFFVNFASAEEFDIDKFMEQYGDYVQNLIKSNLKYDGEEMADTTISYRVNYDGSITNIKLVKASGTKFDEAVISAVEKSAPLKPFPENSNLVSIDGTCEFHHVVRTYKSARIAIKTVEPDAATQKAYKDYTDKVSKYMFDRIPTIFSYIPQEPVIECIILKDGTIKNLHIQKTSGIEEYDKKIIEVYTGMKVQPFPPELNSYEEIPFSLRMYKQYRERPILGNPSYMMR